MTCYLSGGEGQNVILHMTSPRRIKRLKHGYVIVTLSLDIRIKRFSPGNISDFKYHCKAWQIMPRISIYILEYMSLQMSRSRLLHEKWKTVPCSYETVSILKMDQTFFVIFRDS